MLGSIDSPGGRLPVLAWATTTMFGVLLFAWLLRRPQREAESPLAAALSFVATARDGRRPAPHQEPAAVSNAGSAAAAAAFAARALVPVDPDPVVPAAPRPTGTQSRPALRFNKAAARGVVRRQITYRLVRLSDGPDDLRTREIMRLDRGDEIEIIGQEGSYIQVRTPTGAVGWVRSDSVYS